jgi:hypothetical protein
MTGESGFVQKQLAEPAQPPSTLHSIQLLRRHEFPAVSSWAINSGLSQVHPQHLVDCRPQPPPLKCGMSSLTRRREKDRHQECWHVFYDDVRVGTITERAGVPVDVDQWGWTCGFHPVSHHFHLSGTAATFDQAREAFASAWNRYLPKCTAEDFEANRYQRAATAWKYAMWDAGCKMPTQTVTGRTKCYCGVEIDNWTSIDHVRACHLEVA